MQLLRRTSTFLYGFALYANSENNLPSVCVPACRESPTDSVSSVAQGRRLPDWLLVCVSLGLC